MEAGVIRLKIKIYESLTTGAAPAAMDRVGP